MRKKIVKYIDRYGHDSMPDLRIAAENKCDIFLTTNEALLKDRKELEGAFDIKIRTPEEMSKK